MKYAARMLAIAVTMLPLLATAQLGSSSKMVTQVPFEFVAGNKTIPAGECVVRAGAATGTLSISNWDAGVGTFSVTTMAGTQKDSAVNALIFHKYGDRYFLAGMKVANNQAIYQIPEGRAEKELRAQNVTETDAILLASSK